MEQSLTKVPVHIEYDAEEKRFSAFVPDIPGCGEGATEAEAIEDLIEALRLYIEVRGIDRAISLIRPQPQVRELDLSDLTRA